MLNPDFRDMLSALCDVQAEFLVVGAYAMSAHGVPRSTGDIDIWVNPTVENSLRVRQALWRFGAPLSGCSPNDFRQPDQVFQIGIAPRRIDLLTSIDGVNFEEAFPRSIAADIDGLPIPVLGPADLVRNKQACGRTKAPADVELLKKRSAT